MSYGYYKDLASTERPSVLVHLVFALRIWSSRPLRSRGDHRPRRPESDAAGPKTVHQGG